MIIIFTRNEDVISVGKSILPYLALYSAFDAVQTVASGVLRGVGKQNIGAAINIAAYYVCGLPSAWYFCFHMELGSAGLMLGMACGTIFQSIVLSYIIFCKSNLLFSSASVLEHDSLGQEVELAELES